ncbi:hypothetical protein EKO04_008719 [Ascochyta lentis]|uniref:AB hydrolase-1 domain-containing protein n=1 Tax=Ascochyta lentis TaxID=205686 RepID=A0A8H7MH89_9PLEO|nr:hypothetical protein EKO04_008719 [Ascochyta lentis]
MLRLYLRARPAARGALHKTVGFGGASYISLSLSTPIKIGDKSSSTMAAQDDSGDGELRAKTQQSPLASQRQEAQAGRVAKWFPLSASEGFSQWWAGLSPMATEHRVLSFIPHLQRPPTHTQTGSAPASTSPSAPASTSPSAPASTSPSSADLTAAAPPQHAEDHTTTDALTDPYGPRQWNSHMVELSGKGRALNEFSVERLGEHVDENLVMLHGYGAGLGFFYRNFEALSRAHGWKVYALDLLGMGRSSRSPFKIHAKDKHGKIAEAESFFVDALEEWRIKRGLDRFTLLGHSLGGYLAVAYALKYPGHLNKLILASPVGIPEDPFAVSDDMPDPNDSTMVNEFTQDASATRNGVQPSTADNNNFLNQAKKNKETPDQPPRRRMPGWLTYLWEANLLSPFSFVRWSGPLGPRLVSGWTSRRFSHLPEDEAQALHDYSYALFRQRGSSEYALGYLLAPGAFARSPLIRRIHGVGRQWIGPHATHSVDGDDAPPSSSTPQSQQRRETGFPILFLYGENDWMDVKGGHAAAEKISKERDRVLAGKSREEREQDRASAKVVIIKKAGHHVYLDGWEQFNQVMLEEMRETRETRKGG